MGYKGENYGRSNDMIKRSDALPRHGHITILFLCHFAIIFVQFGTPPARIMVTCRQTFLLLFLFFKAQINSTGTSPNDEYYEELYSSIHYSFSSLLRTTDASEKCTFVWVGDHKVPAISRRPDGPVLLTNNVSALNSSNYGLKYSIQCSIVAYFTPIKGTSLEFVDDNWLTFIPGAIFHSFHFLLQAQEPSKLFLSIPFVRRLSNVLIFFKSNNSGWDVVSPNRFQGVPTYFTVAKLHPTSDNIPYTPKSHKIFWNKWKDLQGEPLIVAAPATLTDETVLWHREKKALSYPAFEVSEAARFLNAKPKVVDAEMTHRFGERQNDSTWDGFVGKVMCDRVYLTYPFFPTAEQYKAVLLSKPVMLSQVRFLTPRPKKVGITLNFLTAPFDNKFWTGLLVSIALNALVLCMLKGTGKSRSWKGSAVTDVLMLKRPLLIVCKRALIFCAYFIRPLIDQPLPPSAEVVAKKISGSRFLLLSWLVAGVVIGIHYKSVVVSVLVKPVYENPPQTVSQLVDSGFQVNVAMYNTVISGNIPWENKLRKPIENFGFNFSECLRTLLKDDNACLFLLHWLYLQAPRDLVDASGRHLFLVSKESVHFVFNSFYISQRNPQLKTAMDKVADVFVEGGLTNKWVSHIFYVRLIKTIRRKREAATRVKEKYEQADITLLRYPLLIYTGCCVFACLCHLTLHIYHRCYNAIAKRVSSSTGSIIFVQSTHNHSSLPTNDVRKMWTTPRIIANVATRARRHRQELGTN